MHAQIEGSRKASIGGHIDEDIATVSGDIMIIDALDIMIADDAPMVMVIEGGDVIGLMTSSDIGSMVARGVDLRTGRARDFASLCGMSGSRSCIRVDRDEEPINVLKAMNGWGVDRMLVVKNNDEVVGTVTALGALRSWREGV